MVKGTITADTRININGDVHLILEDGCDFTVNGGIQVRDDDDNIDNGSANALTIYAQSTDESTMGKLTAQNVNNRYAGIGGDENCSGGNITISGGNYRYEQYYCLRGS